MMHDDEWDLISIFLTIYYGGSDGIKYLCTYIHIKGLAAPINLHEQSTRFTTSIIYVHYVDTYV